MLMKLVSFLQCHVRTLSLLVLVELAFSYFDSTVNLYFLSNVKTRCVCLTVKTKESKNVLGVHLSEITR